MYHRIKWTLALSAAALVAASSAQAQGRGKHHHGKHQEIYRNDGRDIYERDRNNRDVYRRDVFGNVYRIDRRIPPGLAKKPGHMPPGQYKKRYNTYEGASILGEIMRRRGYSVVRNVPAGDSRYVYYRWNDGITQRAVVSPGYDQLGFENVPATLLQAVLARLY